MEKTMLTFLLVLSSLLTVNPFSDAVDVINSTHVITDGGDTLISSGGTFELGFFSPGSSKNRYVGIWFKNISAFTVVWVANRNNPLTNSSTASLIVTQPGILALVNGSNKIIWSTNTSRVARNAFVKLLDSGNLVVKEGNDNDDDYLWQSFDYPTNTILPGMKFGKNFLTGHENYMSAWRNSEDPADGDYTCRLDPTGYPQAVLRRGSVKVFSTGPWNGLRYSGLPGMKTAPGFAFDFVLDKNQVYYSYRIPDNSVIPRLVLNETGFLQRWTWMARNQVWALYMNLPTDNCDSYKQCGVYGSCNVQNNPICGCLRNFVPRNSEEWMSTDWSNGCLRRVALDCGTDGFVKYSGIKLPDTEFSWFNASMNLQECELLCRKNCSCVAYTNSDIRNGGSGCLAWFRDLVDIKELYGEGQDIYIRMASSELDSRREDHKILIVILTSSLGVILLSMSFGLWIYMRNKKYLKLKSRSVAGQSEESDGKDLELPLYDLSTISKATHNFSLNNKLGEGGFGPVYKGILGGGQEITVKRLSKASLQGIQEFKNEVIFIAKLQHRNLVKILGCCVEGEETMLVYEYMPNKSLDFILFDHLKSKLLDWPKRFQIICGIARGLVYLHQDSRLRIIHRDLKASNILLDTDMNPKISDFGLARSFGGNEIEANTSRVVGTYGYMSPEYAFDGLFSVKSDVYSFGVIVLEILSGKRIKGYSYMDHQNLLGHACVLYKEGKSLELVDSNLVEPSYVSEMLRIFHVGLLCVQYNPEDRPNMSSVVFMLENETELTRPKQPGFFVHRDVLPSDTSSSSAYTSSANEITITMPKGVHWLKRLRTVACNWKQ
ncbi:hypothetical protein ABFX02_01G094200 [Erythranthe guttata]